jgi:4-carboxymuconolactone decarboxylase
MSTRVPPIIPGTRAELEAIEASIKAQRAYFDARALVELVATVAAYNMVSRFLEALQIGH